MTYFKSFKYRIYPTPAQEAKLLRWENSLRFLWNLALEQCLLGMKRCKGEKVYPSAFDQAKELKELRKKFSWIRDVPRSSQMSLLQDLEKSWKKCFKKISKRPNFKSKLKSQVNISSPNPDKFYIENNLLKFPKIGKIRTILDRTFEGKQKRCTISRDGDQWFASVLCEINAAVIPRQALVNPVALDRGIVNTVADSNGKIIPNPKHMERVEARLKRAQRRFARKEKNSKNQAKAKIKIMRLHRKVRRQREHELHKLSLDYAKNHSTVIVEDLKISNMGKIGRGLSRSIYRAAWGKFALMLEYKCKWFGSELIKVPAAYSSQTCSNCFITDPESRLTQATYTCTTCQHTENADVNAAKVLLKWASERTLSFKKKPCESPGSDCGGIGVTLPIEAVNKSENILEDGNLSNISFLEIS
jgi:putative transposase